ncbi:TRAP transporter substrate-binding protein [Roseospira marina]|uniref:TRAP transporter substrate-binding protein n=1 Tax=Roseospira marina TaxID=140057 RepID=A0A5M6IAH9_9PROT|nr:TRAP transporter substrate-binding protein [Roseospira marina]KAA5604668.1 TRAP transporter substrate-binding protein [Roseospira marina]MBB4315113.1 TRAP-type mannitol/chloroaromatic compound transport system substrate-binding protein [Roseospira marina]MBB5088117.1 TRAP-type mannitol/chloroaromatic compound transport system substrate-binding protein [Roseospira marina]
MTLQSVTPLLKGAAGAVLGVAMMAAPALAADYEWTFQTSETAGEPQFKIKQAWADNINEMSGGRIEIEILPTGAVVPHNQTLDAVGSGILQGHLTDPSYFSGLDPAFSMLGNLVGAWGDPLEFLEYMQYGGGEELYNELVNPYNVQLIGAAATGLEALVSKKPIRTVEDLQGLKLRAPEGMVYDIFSKAGATPVNLPGSEVYTGLEKGVIDAADYTVFATNQDQGLHSFARYPSYPGFHSLPMVAVSMNKEIWDGLPDDLKAIMSTATDALAYDLVFKLKARDLVAVAEARADPDIEIIDLPAPERKKFRAIAQQEWANWAKRNEMTQKVYDSVVVFLKDRNLL